MYCGEMKKPSSDAAVGGAAAGQPSSSFVDLERVVHVEEAAEDVPVVAAADVRCRFLAWRKRRSCSSSLTKSMAPPMMEAWSPWPRRRCRQIRAVRIQRWMESILGRG